MPELMEITIPLGVGAGDGLSDAGLQYVDEATGREAAPLLKRPSTIAHLAVSTVAGAASYMFLSGNSKLMGFQVAGRHLGKVGGDAAWAFAHEEPMLGGEFELEMEPSGMRGLELEKTVSGGSSESSVEGMNF